MFYGLPFLSAIVLAFVDKLTTWWGILIVAVALFLALSLASGQDRHEGSFFHRTEFFFVGLGQIAGIYIGYAIWSPWGALVGGFLMNTAGTLLTDWWMPRHFDLSQIDPGVFDYGPTRDEGRAAKRHCRAARLAGYQARYDKDWTGDWQVHIVG